MEKQKMILKQKFDAQAFAVAVIAVSVVFIILSSVVMAIIPRGADGESWSLLHIGKIGWDNTNAAFCLAFWVAVIGYVYIKKDIIRAYLTQKFNKGMVLSFVYGYWRECVAALAIALFVLVSTAWSIPPVSKFASWRDSISRTSGSWFAPASPRDEMMERVRAKMEDRMRLREKLNDAGTPPTPAPVLAPDADKGAGLPDRDAMRERKELMMRKRMLPPGVAPEGKPEGKIVEPKAQAADEKVPSETKAVVVEKPKDADKAADKKIVEKPKAATDKAE